MHYILSQNVQGESYAVQRRSRSNAQVDSRIWKRSTQPSESHLTVKKDIASLCAHFGIEVPRKAKQDIFQARLPTE